MRTHLFIIGWIFLLVSCSTNKEIIYFSDGYDSYQGTLPLSKKRQDEIYNVYNYYLKDNWMEYSCTPAFYEDIPFLDRDILLQEIASEQNIYQNIQLPKGNFWKDLRSKQLRYLVAKNRLRLTTIDSFKNPEELWDFEVPLTSFAYQYRSLVFSTDIEKMKDAVCDLQIEYFEGIRDETDDADRLRFYLISLGWWMNAQKDLPKQTEKKLIFDQFKRLLKKVQKYD